jgi:hypothetical protein
MSTITKHKCDICQDDAVHLKKPLQVVFVTEQTEGRSVTPHLSLETLDLCHGCLQRIVERHPVIGSGAQGHNTYRLKG